MPLLPPYTVDGEELIYPKDTQAGGSWIVLKANGDAAVLLNGADVKHERRLSYRKSRGLVVLDLLGASDYNIYMIGIGLGTASAFTLYGLAGDFLQMHIQNEQPLISGLIGAALLVTAFFQACKLWQNN